MYECFQESIQVIGPALTSLFNHILNTGNFPSNWSKGLIVPVYKKGDASDTNNYRGITLISCFVKLFTNIINDRLQNWAIYYDVLTDAQFGFKPNFSTTDAMFALKALIDKKLNNKQKLFCCFIDFQKAYDMTDMLVHTFTIWY